MLKRPAYAVAGVLEMLWMLAAQHAEDGDLSRFSPVEIADYIEWEGDAEELIKALIETKWLENSNGVLCIHDWDDHCPDYLKDRHRKRRQRGESKDTENGGLSGDCPGNSGTFRDIPGKSPLAMPSPALPSQAMSNHQLASLPAEGDGLALEWIALTPKEVESLIPIANRFMRRLKSVDASWVWRVAWVAYCVEKGYPVDLCQRLESGDVKKPMRYLETALQGELDRWGYKLERVMELVPAPPPMKGKPA